MEPDTRNCPYCAETIKAEAVKCRYCGEFLTFEALDESAGRIPVRLSAYNPGLAAVLSTVIPGLGQIFQGRLGVGFSYMGILLGLNLLTIGAFLSEGGQGIAPVLALFAIAVYLNNIVNAHQWRPDLKEKQQREYERLNRSQAVQPE